MRRTDPIADTPKPLHAVTWNESVAMSIAADTTKTPGRRSLRFRTINDVLADMDRIVAAEEAGTLRQSGNWTAGQAFGHIAAWMNYAYDGYPFKVPWFIRLILRIRVRKYLRDGLPTGVRIPKVKGGTYATQALSTEEGAAQLRRALARLAGDEPATYDNPAFGKASDEDRIALNLRHAELHLGFLQP